MASVGNYQNNTMHRSCWNYYFTGKFHIHGNIDISSCDWTACWEYGVSRFQKINLKRKGYKCNVQVLWESNICTKCWKNPTHVSGLWESNICTKNLKHASGTYRIKHMYMYQVHRELHMYQVLRELNTCIRYCEN